MQFDSYEKIYKAIAAVNSACYPKIKENAFFLEQANDKNMVKVMQEIRDAYDHLHHIFVHPAPFSLEGQAVINSEFEKYKGHMQRLAIELIRKVSDYYINLIKNYFKCNGLSGEWNIIKTQIALQVKCARDREVNADFHQRYASWMEILEFTDDIIKKYNILDLVQ